MATSTIDKVMLEISPVHSSPSAKVTVVGVGQVGMAITYGIMLEGLAAEIALVDVNKSKLQGEMMDLQHGQSFRQKVTIRASQDYSITSNSKVCVVTAGARQVDGESRLDLVHRNIDIFKHIIPPLIKYSPDTILVIVSNPVDVLTYVAWRLSGLPHHRVIGSGTMLDSSRFRFLLSERLGIAPQSCHAYIIGEHGDSSVAVWSSVSVAGVRLQDISPTLGEANDPENWRQLHTDVINSAYEIIKLKGYTSWGIGSMICALCRTIMKNERRVYTLSTVVTGMHGINYSDIFLSVPCVVGESGVTHVLQQTLNDSETQQLQRSAATLADVISRVTL